MGIDRRRYLMAASAGAVDAPEYAVVALNTSQYGGTTWYSGSIDGGATWYGGINTSLSTPVKSGSLQILPTGYAYRAVNINKSYRFTYLQCIDILSGSSDEVAAWLGGYSGKFALSRDKIIFEYYRGRSYTNYIVMGTGSFDISKDPIIAPSTTSDIITEPIVSYLDYESSTKCDGVRQHVISEDGQTAISMMAQNSYANTDVIARYSEGGLNYGTWETILMDSQSSGQVPHSVDISNDGQVCVLTTSDGYYFSRTGPSNLRYTASYDSSGYSMPSYGCSVSGNGKAICITSAAWMKCSVDSGTTWIKYSDYNHSRVYTAAVKVVSNYKGDKILVNRSGSLYGSVDYGNTFTNITFENNIYGELYVADVAMNKWEKFKN